MAKFVLAYKGGGAPASDADREAVMAAWGNWFGELGQAVLDPGNPFAASMSVAADGALSDGASSGVSGYSILTAEDLGGAAELAKGSPILANGGSVEVHEVHDVM